MTTFFFVVVERVLCGHFRIPEWSDREVFPNSNPGNATTIRDQKSQRAYLAVGGLLLLSYLSVIAALTNHVSLCMEEGG